MQRSLSLYCPHQLPQAEAQLHINLISESRLLKSLSPQQAFAWSFRKTASLHPVILLWHPLHMQAYEHPCTPNQWEIASHSEEQDAYSPECAGVSFNHSHHLMFHFPPTPIQFLASFPSSFCIYPAFILPVSCYLPCQCFLFCFVTCFCFL